MFAGAYTAIATPFNASGAVDTANWKRLSSARSPAALTALS